MHEERSLKRRHLIYYLVVTDQSTGQPLGRLLDVTTEGMLLFSEEPIETNRIYNLSIALPKDIVTKKEIFLRAKSLHCNRDSEPRFYNTGFKIEELEERDRLTLIRVINRYSFQD